MLVLAREGKLNPLEVVKFEGGYGITDETKRLLGLKLGSVRDQEVEKKSAVKGRGNLFRKTHDW